MIIVTKNCYCDMLAEHDNQKVAGASPFKGIVVMRYNADNELVPEITTLDLCPACRARYSTNITMSIDARGQKSYAFPAASTQSTSTTAG